MLNSVLKIFVGPVMGGLNPHQPPPPNPREYATGDIQPRKQTAVISRHC
jgi:hypothetical protein